MEEAVAAIGIDCGGKRRESSRLPMSRGSMILGDRIEHETQCSWEGLALQQVYRSRGFEHELLYQEPFQEEQLP